jgi:hypothetical protein
VERGGERWNLKNCSPVLQKILAHLFIDNQCIDAKYLRTFCTGAFIGLHYRMRYQQQEAQPACRSQSGRHCVST